MRKNFSLEIYVIFMVTAECCLRAIYDALRRLNTNTYGNHESGFNIAKENPRLFGRGFVRGAASSRVLLCCFFTS